MKKNILLPAVTSICMLGASLAAAPGTLTTSTAPSTTTSSTTTTPLTPTTPTTPSTSSKALPSATTPPTSAPTSAGKQPNKLATANEVRRRAHEFTTNFAGPFTADATHAQTVGSYSVPQLKSGDLILNDNPIVDTFATRTNGAAAIFAKVDKNYVPIASSLKQEDGTSAKGTPLEHTSPAYKHLNNGLSYTGKVTLANKEYMAKYDIIRDKRGQPIGAFLIAIPTTQ